MMSDKLGARLIRHYHHDHSVIKHRCIALQTLFKCGNTIVNLKAMTNSEVITDDPTSGLTSICIFS